jgi:hypothetical protein
MSDNGDRKQPRRKRHPIHLDRDRIRVQAFQEIRALRERQRAKGPTPYGAAPVPPSPAPSPHGPERARHPRPTRGRGGATLRWSLALNAALVVALIFAGTMSPVFAPVVTLEWQDRGVTLHELNGTEKWRHEFPARVRHAEIAPWTRVPRFVLVSYWNDGSGPGQLALYDIRKDREIWCRSVDRKEIEAVFGEDLTVPGEMFCNAFTFVDLEGDGEPEIAATFHHEHWLPACIRTYDRDGTVLGTYYHWGYINDLAAHDLDGDGREEILGAGTNNVHDGATIVVLDRTHLSGYSADATIPRFAEHPEGARVRVVLPPWEREIMDLIPMERLGFGALIVSGEGRDSVIRGRITIEGGLPVRFDADLRPVSAIPPGFLITRARQWLDNGETTVDITTDGYWAGWLSRCMRFTAPAPPS